jgi:hypothetical protein
MPNKYFNTTSYSKWVWDKILFETQHYFSVSKHITPDIISNDLLAAEQAEEQLNTLDRYIQENAQVFQSMHKQIQNQFKHMDAKLETVHKIEHICGNGYLCISLLQLQTHALKNTQHSYETCSLECDLYLAF